MSWSDTKKKSTNDKKLKKPNFFSKLKQVFSPGSSSTSIASRTKSREDDRESFGTVATRTRSRMSMFGSHRENKDALEAERQLEERKSKCLAIKAAKRDPAAVQRLLVDCEFCNPPPKFGREITIENQGYTAEDAARSLEELEALKEQQADLSDERKWNVGLDAWLRMRERWLQPTEDEQPVHHLDSDLTPDRYYTVYDKLIYQTRPLQQPLNLSDVIKIVKAGWVGEGSWPQAGDGDAWSTTENEDVAAYHDSHPHTEEQRRAPQMSVSPSPAGSRNDSTTVSPQTSALNGSYTNNNNNNINGNTTNGSGNGPQKPQVTPQIHVQFSDIPHPRESTPRSNEMPRLERVQSSMGVPIRPMRSSQSSVVSITDSE